MSETAPTFTFEEQGVATPLRVELRDDDLPYGKPWEEVAFKSGLRLEHSRKDIAGRPDPVVQARKVVSPDLEINGAFRDWFSATPGHAKAMRDAINEVVARANVLTITASGEERDGLLIESDFGEERNDSITYRLTFLIFRAPGQTAPVATTSPSGDSDAVAQQLAAIDLTPTPPAGANLTFAASLNTSWSQIAQAVSAAQTSVQTLERAADGVAGAVRRVLSLTTAAGNLCTSLEQTLAATTYDVAMSARTASAQAAWWRYQLAGLDQLHAVRDVLRSCRTTARARQYQATRLYRVRPGDTLESIARTQLGSASRVSELGLRPDQLTVGLLVRIPEAP